ncbi:MAG TPA: DUF4845 domain-containing protein [Candidatus Acidoferrales bacterium]
MIRSPQRGGSNLKAIVWLVVVVIIVYVAVKVIPHYFNDYQLEDAMKTEARFAAVNRRTPEQVREVVYKKVQELEIPAKREDIRVEPISDGYRISVQYTVTVTLPGYQFTMRFNPTADNRSI